MKSLKKVGVVFCLILIANFTMAQDPTFTQFYANPIYLNPAFAGSHGCPRISLNYRNEWPSLSGNYTTYSASYDKHIKGISGGVGLMATHDEQGKGTINTTTLNLIYSYQLKITRNFTARFGAQASYYQKTLDWNKLTFGDQIDPRKGFIYATGDQQGMGSKGYFDASFGMIAYTKTFFFGVAGHHINRPDESLIKGHSYTPIRITGHAGAEIKLGKKSRFNNPVSIMPNIIYQYQNGFQEINIGTYVKYNFFTFGAWFRNKDAFILSAGINTGTFRLGYSYDITLSKLNNGISGGSHEISLGLYLNCKEKPTTYKLISCPSF